MHMVCIYMHISYIYVHMCLHMHNFSIYMFIYANNNCTYDHLLIHSHTQMIATKLSQMRYLHEYTNYVSIKRRLVEEEHKSRYLHSLVIPEPRLNYRFPIESIKLAAIDEALQYKGFPDVMPWNTHAAKTRRHKLKAVIRGLYI